MAKNNRGKSLYRQPSRTRGTCPVCLATRIKLLETVKKSDGTQLQVCKRCSNASSQRVESAVTNQQAAALAFRRQHKQALHQLQAEMQQR